MGRGVSVGGSDYYPDGYSDELPEHIANIDAFALDRYEVTVGRFRRFVEAYDAWRAAGNPQNGAGARSNVAASGWLQSWMYLGNELPSSSVQLRQALSCSTYYSTWTENAAAFESYPINCVTWYEAFAFCLWDGGWLPTEAEWEYAAAGGGGPDGNRLYPWGSAEPTQALANCWDTWGEQESPTPLEVGSKPAGVGRWGHFDLAGSMDEWVMDWYGDTYYGDADYPSTCDECMNATPSQSATRVARGGSWYWYWYKARAAYRNLDKPDTRRHDFGFRCARPAQ
jgi:formylglycine-generating enzyme required for sulfatase activity